VSALSRTGQSQEAAVPTGTVKWFNATKGYGFIEPEDGGRDVYVHSSVVQRAGLIDLKEGQQVAFEMISDRGGMKAANLRIV
jgi:CspA family cold shock protein